MSDINSAIVAATAYFGALVVLALTVTGFFKGRSWLKKVDGEDDTSEDCPF